MPDDRPPLRRHVTLAVLGILIGIVTTFFNTFVESEYQYEHDSKILEYSDDCKPMPPIKNAVRCTLTVQARGRNSIKDVHLEVTAQPTGSSNEVPRVTPVSLISSPKFAPPDPSPQIETNARNPGFAMVTSPRMMEPQKLIWNVDIAANAPINMDTQIQRIVSAGDDQATIKYGHAWVWERWIPLAVVVVGLPLVVIGALALVRWKTAGPQIEGSDAIWDGFDYS